VSGDLLSQAYKTLKGFPNTLLLLSYEKTTRHPDLTWLDPEDPGFLEFTAKPPEDRIRDVFRLAFFTGAKKALLIDPLSPEIKGDWLSQAFEALNDRTVALGSNQDGSFYLLGLTQQNIKILDAAGFTSGKGAENIAERVKKNKLSLFSAPETYCVNSEDSLRKWLENREKEPRLFKEQQARTTQQQEQETKKHGKRHPRSHEEPTGRTSQETTPLC